MTHCPGKQWDHTMPLTGVEMPQTGLCLVAIYVAL